MSLTVDMTPDGHYVVGFLASLAFGEVEFATELDAWAGIAKWAAEAHRLCLEDTND
jgi:hypothetical protein